MCHAEGEVEGRTHKEQCVRHPRMGMRRMTRLTNAFSKKWENLKAAYALWFAFYNFLRVHQTLRVTPATEAGITDHVWTIEEMLDFREESVGKLERGGHGTGKRKG